MYIALILITMHVLIPDHWKYQFLYILCIIIVKLLAMNTPYTMASQKFSVFPMINPEMNSDIWIFV